MRTGLSPPPASPLFPATPLVAMETAEARRALLDSLDLPGGGPPLLPNILPAPSSTPHPRSRGQLSYLGQKPVSAT